MTEEAATPRRQVPQRVVDAAGHAVAPARVLAVVAGALLWVALVAGGVLSIAVLAAAWGEGAGALVGAVVALVVLLVPAWWLHHARSTFRDVIDLPGRLRDLNAGVAPFSVSKADLSPSSLRAGGIRRAVGTIRTTVAEVSDFISPASTVAEIVAPPFWVWTAVAAGAAIVLALSTPIVLLVLALT